MCGERGGRRERGGLPNLPHEGATLDPQRFTKKTLGSYTFFSLRLDREQHVPDSSNHSLFPEN